MKIVVEENKKYKDLTDDFIKNIKKEKTPLVCLTGLATEYSLDFNFLVFDTNNEIKSKFIHLQDAVEYAKYLATKL
jgi:hypothetical protein